MDRRHRRADNPTARPLRRLLPVFLTLLLTLTAAAGALHWHAQYRAEQEAQAWAESLGRSTAILIQPLLLADDRVSLNYLFNELDSQPLLNGLKLTDPHQLVVAVSGQEQGVQRTLVLSRGEETLGELTLWISPEPVFKPLSEQLVLAAGAVVASLLATLIMLWLRLRAHPTAEPAIEFRDVAADLYPPLTEAPNAAPITASSTVRRVEVPANAGSVPTPAQVRVSDDDYPLTLDDLDEPDPMLDQPETSAATAAPRPEQEPEPDADVLARKPQPAAAPDEAAETDDDVWANADSDAPISFDFDDSSSALALEDDETPRPEPEHTANPGHQQEQKPELETEPEPEEDASVDLVELLKPDRDAPQSMPHFTPSEREAEIDGDDAIAPELESVEFEDDAEPEPTAGHRRPNLSLVSPLSKRDEEQLGLYTLEHELELMLPAGEAGYLFLIDATSAHADNIDPDERKTLLRHYRTLANSVAHIYSGRVEALAAGDLQLFFDAPSEDDSHGINALCSAMLFTSLYKQYNQYRIRQFKPVMNLHMAVVRGHYQKGERLLEEARFLTRTTHSNELISHTALTEAPDLKDTLLENADIRREDEDKVLVIRVAKSYQELLDKQARYLLSKLQSREQENQPS